MFRLPDRVGFGQRHCTSTNPSSFLTHLCSAETEKYHRSPVTTKLIREDLLSYTNTCKIVPTDVSLHLAVQKAREAFRLPTKVRPYHLNDVFSLDLQIWKSSPGLPWREHGYRTKDDIRHDRDAITSIRLFWHKVKLGINILPPDSCAFVRSHICEKPDHKVRAVWGYPATISFGECMFAKPLIDAYQRTDCSPFAYGYETALGGSRKLRELLGSSGGKHFTGLDFKSFDKTVPAWLISIAFEILAENIDFLRYEEYGTPDCRKLYVMWNYIIDYFINTPIRLCTGERWKKSSGVASGSYFTQLIDTIVNYILVNWMIMRQQGEFPLSQKYLGDDSIISTRKKVDLDKARDLFSTIGMALNPTKSSQSDRLSDLSFLGYTLEDSPSKPFHKWVASLLYPERYDRSFEDVQSRALGLLYANCGVDATFDVICRGLVKFRPFDLRLPRNLQRMLWNIGIHDVCRDPPTPEDFFWMLHFGHPLKVK